VSIRCLSKIWKMPAMQPILRSNSGMSSGKAVSTLLAGGISRTDQTPLPLGIHRTGTPFGAGGGAEQEKVPRRREEKAGKCRKQRMAMYPRSLADADAGTDMEALC
jgi:hypothetical protein